MSSGPVDNDLTRNMPPAPASAVRATGKSAKQRIAGRPSRLRRYEPLLFGTGTVLLILIVWQVVTMTRLVPKLFLAGPSDIIAAYGTWNAQGGLWLDIRVSAEEVVLGFALALAVGLPMGILTGWYRRLGLALDPVINFLNATPRIALIPLIIIWLGIELPEKIAVVFISSVITVIVNTQVGVKSLDSNLLTAARSFGASDSQVVRTIALPGALPFILAGVRLGIGQSLIAMVVAELIAAQVGVGLVMATAGEQFQTPLVFAALFIVAGMGVLLSVMLRRLERRFQSWRPNG